MMSKCKACGACEKPERCECCGKCANCGREHGFPPVPASPFYYEPLDPWRITCTPTWQPNIPALVPRAPIFTGTNTGCH